MSVNNSVLDRSLPFLKRSVFVYEKIPTLQNSPSCLDFATSIALTLWFCRSTFHSANWIASVHDNGFVFFLDTLRNMAFLKVLFCILSKSFSFILCSLQMWWFYENTKVLVLVSRRPVIQSKGQNWGKKERIKSSANNLLAESTGHIKFEEM